MEQPLIFIYSNTIYVLSQQPGGRHPLVFHVPVQRCTVLSHCHIWRSPAVFCVPCPNGGRGTGGWELPRWDGTALWCVEEMECTAGLKITEGVLRGTACRGWKEQVLYAAGKKETFWPCLTFSARGCAYCLKPTCKAVSLGLGIVSRAVQNVRGLACSRISFDCSFLCSDAVLRWVVLSLLFCWWGCPLAVPCHATFRYFEFLDHFSSSSFCVSLCFCNPLLSGLYQWSCTAVLNTRTLPWLCLWEQSSTLLSLWEIRALMLSPYWCNPQKYSKAMRIRSRAARGACNIRTGQGPALADACGSLSPRHAGQSHAMGAAVWQVAPAAGCPCPSSAQRIRQVMGTIKRQLCWKRTVTLWNRDQAPRKWTKLTEPAVLAPKLGCGVTHKPILYIILAMNLQRRSVWNHGNICRTGREKVKHAAYAVLGNSRRALFF